MRSSSSPGQSAPVFLHKSSKKGAVSTSPKGILVLSLLKWTTIASFDVYISSSGTPSVKVESMRTSSVTVDQSIVRCLCMFVTVHSVTEIKFKKKCILAQSLQHRGHHSPAEMNLLGSLGNMIISFSVRVYALTPTRGPHWGGY